MKNIVIILLVLCTNPLMSSDYVFEHISSNDGLSNNLIRDIIQDEKGYLWFATSGGLNRFNGHSFDVYKTVMGDTASLSDSRLSVVFEDKNGFIWARSILGNVHRVDPTSNVVLNFKEMGIIPKSSKSTSHFVSSNGDVWITHSSGLLRAYYTSGRNAKLKIQSFDNEPWMQNNSVNFVYEDSNQNIWIGTNQGVLRLVVPQHELYEAKPDFFYKDGENAFVQIHEYEQKLYMGANSGRVFIYDIISQQFVFQNLLSGYFNGNVSSINHNEYGQVIFGSTQGEILHFEPENSNVQYFKQFPGNLPFSSYISEIFTDSYDTFWLVTEKRGVYQYLPSQRKFRYYGLNYSNRYFLGEPDKQILLEDSNNNLWVGVNGGGLFLYDRKEQRFQHFKHSPDNTGSLSSDIVLSMYEDRSKNLWIGTSYGGVNKISLKSDRLRRIAPVDNPKTGFDNYIRSVTTDVLGNVWVGTKAGKIHIYKDRELIGTLPDDLNNSDAFPATNVYCLFFDSDHNLWIGTKGNGIYIIKSMLSFIDRLHHADVEVVHLVHDPFNSNSLSSDNVYSINQDVHGQYWIGTFLGGLDLLTNPFEGAVFQNFLPRTESSSGIVSNEVRDLFFDVQQNLWIATSEGVSILESKYLRSIEKRFVNLSPSIIDENSMSGKVVYQIKQSKNDDIFLAMLDGGINQLKASDFQKRNFNWIHHKNQILSPNVYSIEEDYNGNIWMGTDNGLFSLDVANGVIEKYHIKNSYLPLTFSEGCSQKTSKQELVFGSNDGFLIFHPDSIQKDSTQFPILFSRLEVNGEHITSQNSSILKSSIEEQEQIKLKHDQNNINMYFSVLDFERPDAIQYSYILEGYDSYWSNPTTNNSAMYRKIPPGEYTLKVNGTNSSGAWMNKTETLNIVISPPFWKSTAGYILIILIVSLLITTSTIIMYRQIIMQNKARVEKAINEKRIEYYTNISHEFKTPLSLILSPVEEIIMSHKSSDFARNKGLQIKKNAIYLKRLIDQILDFRKIREGKMQLKVSEMNIIEFFREIYLVFLPLSQRIGVKFDYQYNVDSFFGYCDLHQLEKVFYNLLSNAFRYTPQGREVILKVDVDKENGKLLALVIDAGVGINENELPHIFDRFNNSKNSTGIGLFFTKEIVTLHKGKIDVFNNEKGGATFEVQIPVYQEFYVSGEIDRSVEQRNAFDLNSIDDIEIIISHQSSKEKVVHRGADYLETILIVEDNDEMRDYLASELSGRYRVIEAENGVQGIELAQTHIPQLIISDIVMPKADGYELTKTLKDSFETNHIPIILLTAEDSDEKKLRGAECGADDYVTKPFSVNYLIAKIEQTISQRKKLKKKLEIEAEEVKSVEPNGENKNNNTFNERVNNLVIENISDPDMNVEYLVEKMGISRTLFFKKMKAASGYAPNEYLRIIRMKEAARLIVSGDKTISEISNAIGYNDSNYFSKTFKKHFGETPSAYKLKHSKRNVI
jgi:signal transduction histidine kinase/ligand-binding sensor domain-containing protein/AraC-like DNA-binding protein/AmiR/NasT family two-component response regulator